MKTLFIKAKLKVEPDLSKILKISKQLPKNILLAYSVQYGDYAKKLESILSKEHKVLGNYQVLGCSKPRIPNNCSAILLIGSGKFHAVSLALETDLPIYIIENHTLSRVSEQEIQKLKATHKSAYLKFLTADKIGILVSTKPGQSNLPRAIKLRKSLKSKKSYLFLSNNIDSNQFQNFHLNSWVNTACKRMDFDNPAIINISDIEKQI